MKILFIYKTYYPETYGGVEEVLRVLMTGLVQQGHQCTLLVASKGDRTYSRVEQGVTIHYCPATVTLSSCPFSLSFLRKFRALSAEYELIHFHFPWPYADLAQFLLRPNIPYFVTYHSDIVKQKIAEIFYAPLRRWFLDHAAAIIATSEPYKKSSPVLARYGAAVQVIPLGLQEGPLPETFALERQRWLQQIGKDFFLFLGVLRYYKGLPYLLEAAVGNRLTIVIAGSGPEEKSLRALAQAKQLTKVHFVGQVSENDKAALLNLCKAVVIPASERSEAYCLSLVEGLRAGKPLISTELGTGTSFVNEHGLTGLVVPPKNAQKLSEAMHQIEQDPQLCAKFAQEARQRFETCFTNTVMVEAYNRLFIDYSTK
jgi:glycosyltransferase involved in cell wall biosynthesis